MRIFLSYASEYRNVADRLAVGLAQEGHRVFFDRDSLPVGEGYDAAIRDEVAQSDLLIFLVAPESLESGAYTLTELDYARRRWRNPAQRVLPVVVREVAFASLPPYLGSVTVLEPHGNLIAETLAAVAALERGRRRRTLLRVGAGLVAALAIGAVIVRLRPIDGLPAPCYLSAELKADGATTGTGSRTLSVTGGGVTDGFMLADQGPSPIQLRPEQVGDWQVELQDAEGRTLGSARLRGCPAAPEEVRIDATHRLVLSPR